MRTKIWTLLAAAGSIGLHSPVQAGLIVGGSELVTSTYLTQLETWLGAGELTLTRIFAKEDGDTSADFHAAVDDQGATIAVIEVVHSTNSATIIGGYNPQSWNGAFNGYRMTVPDSERTAFVFNLTHSFIFRQRLSTDAVCGTCGEFQTYDSYAAGPSFGMGMDIGVAAYLDHGSSYLYSYGTDMSQGMSIVDLVEPDIGDPPATIVYGRIEVFTVAPSDREPGALPEPGSLALAGLGLGAAMLARRRVGPRSDA